MKVSLLLAALHALPAYSLTPSAALRPSPLASPPHASAFVPSPPDTHVLVLGATGYIGGAVTRELSARGFKVSALVRPGSSIPGPNLSGVRLIEGDVTDKESLRSKVFEAPDGPKVDAVISCVSSRTGAPKECWRVDYGGSKNALDLLQEFGGGVKLGRDESPASPHFVLLSAVCVKNPLLELQRAKLAIEADLETQHSSSSKAASREVHVRGRSSYEASARAAGGVAAGGRAVRYTIVRPTAYFKSLAGQVGRVCAGEPYVTFGDGTHTRANPISEGDLAALLVDGLHLPSMRDKALDVGGPGPPASPAQQAAMLFKALGREPEMLSVPLGLLDGAVETLEKLERVLPVQSVKDTTELARIGRYYATEDMLGPSYGTETLQGFYQQLVDEFKAKQASREGLNEEYGTKALGMPPTTVLAARAIQTWEKAAGLFTGQPRKKENAEGDPAATGRRLAAPATAAAAAAAMAVAVCSAAPEADSTQTALGAAMALTSQDPLSF